MDLPTDKAFVTTPKEQSLDHYFSDEVATDALAKAESDPEAAKDALLIAADYIKRGVPLPGILAHHIAGAIEAAMAKPKELRAKALTDELRLSAVNRRPKADWALVGADVEHHINEHQRGKDRALLDVSERHNIDKRTAERYWRKYKQRSAGFQADMARGRGLLSVK